MSLPVLDVVYPDANSYLTAFSAEIARGGLLVRGAELKGAAAGDEVVVNVNVTGVRTAGVSARVAAIVPGVGVAVMFTGMPSALKDLADSARAPPEEIKEEVVPEPVIPEALKEKLKNMPAAEKTKLALSGGKDERTALLLDPDKTLQLSVLKNPKIELEEVRLAARRPELSADAMNAIADHREWGVNPAVCAALVKNPKTPSVLGLKLIAKVQEGDLRAIARGKTGARDAIVMAAKKRVIL